MLRAIEGTIATEEDEEGQAVIAAAREEVRQAVETVHDRLGRDRFGAAMMATILEFQEGIIPRKAEEALDSQP